MVWHVLKQSEPKDTRLLQLRQSKTKNDQLPITPSEPEETLRREANLDKNRCQHGATKEN
jgi:hypothetical protein